MINPRNQVAVSVRLDSRVLDWLKSKGEGHLTPINDILTNLIAAERRTVPGWGSSQNARVTFGARGWGIPGERRRIQINPSFRYAGTIDDDLVTDEVLHSECIRSTR
jgi:hypothetical protein